MNIKLFSKNNCMQCKMAKKVLIDSNTVFEEINLDEKPSAAKELQEKGLQTVPVTIADDKIIIGFKPGELRALESQNNSHLAKTACSR